MCFLFEENLQYLFCGEKTLGASVITYDLKELFHEIESAMHSVDGYSLSDFLMVVYATQVLAKCYPSTLCMARSILMRVYL
jgi:hypothetical protein